MPETPKMAPKMAPVHPGEILQTEFAEPLGLSQNELARRLKVDARRINEIIHGRRSITADTALRLSRFFGNTADFWLNLQKRYELQVAEDRLEGVLREVQPLEKA